MLILHKPKMDMDKDTDNTLTLGLAPALTLTLTDTDSNMDTDSEMDMDMSTTSNEPRFFEVLEDTDSMKHILAPKTVYFSGEHSWKIALSPLHLGRVSNGAEFTSTLSTMP